VLRRSDFWLALIALVGVLVVPTLEALAIAVVASLGMMVWRASEARLTFLGRPGGGLEPVDTQDDPRAAIPGLLIVRPDEMLFFANAASVRDGILAAVRTSSTPVSVTLLDLSLTPELDVPAVEALDDLHGRLADDGIELWLCHLRPAVRDLLDRAGLLERIGPARIHPRVTEGLLTFALRMPDAIQRVAVLEDLVAFIRERSARPGTAPEGLELLLALERRLSLELATTEDR